MKKLHTIVSWTLGIIVAIALVRAEGGPSSNPPATAKTVLSVGVLMKNVDRHLGRVVTVEGVVSAVAIADHRLGLIDCREFQACGPDGCAELTLPVSWTGSMPSVGQTVRVDGEVREADGKLVFVARTLEKIESPPAKGKK